MTAQPKPAIVFCGFMGAGKTTAARGASRALGEVCHDTDERISERLGEPLEQFFEREGEAEFRRIEAEVVLAAIEAGGVVAIGGGAVETPAVRSALAGAVTVHCEISEKTAWGRTRGTSRPLAAGREEFGRRFMAREPLYREISRATLPQDVISSSAVAAPWLAQLREHVGLRFLWGRSTGGSYPVFIGAGAAGVLGSAPAELVGAKRLCIFDSEAVEAGVPIPGGVSLQIAGHGGEQHKTFGEAERVLEEMARLELLRDDVAVGLGGGVVGDLAGFCAAVYQRGVPIVQVPTTLVAQVDSAYGGKTGVDLPGAKNYVGAYHQPRAVLVDPDRLQTLPQAELAAGFAEVVKTGLIAGGELWEQVRSVERIDAESMARCVDGCAATKLDVVATDERDGGRRQVLNLGHTVGHAIEAASGYARYRHGEAIALGLLAALRLSGLEPLREEVQDLLSRAALPTELHASLDPEAIIAATAMDKKRTSEGLGFVLVRGPGDVVHDQRVGEDDLRDAVGELLR